VAGHTNLGAWVRQHIQQSEFTEAPDWPLTSTASFIPTKRTLLTTNRYWEPAGVVGLFALQGSRFTPSFATLDFRL
jgi:hypothetical protein